MWILRVHGVHNKLRAHGSVAGGKKGKEAEQYEDELPIGERCRARSGTRAPHRLNSRSSDEEKTSETTKG